MELTFVTDIGSFLKENNIDKGWTVLHIYDNKTIYIYLINQQVLGKKIYEKVLSKELTNKDIEKIHIYFKHGFYTNIGTTNIANYDKYIKSANAFFQKI
jgi:hypothetical protein